jgi:predicted PurR-regulated permease PerM
MSRLISLAVLIGIIIVIGLVFYRVVIGFFIPVFLSVVLVVVFRPVHEWVLAKTGHRDSLAATLTTLLIMLALFLPVTLVMISAAVQGLKLVEQNDAATVLLRINKVRDSLGLQMPPYEEQLRLVEAQMKRIVNETDKARDLDFQKMEDALRSLRQLGVQLAVSLEALRDEVRVLWGPRWDASFDELIDMSTRLGTPPDPEEPVDEAGMAKLAVDLRTGFAKLKTNLLGGAFMAVARQAANPTSEDVEALTRQALDFVQPRLLSITGATGGFLLNLAFGSVILIVATFFFLYDGPAMIKTIMHLSPLDDAYERELLMEFESISRAVVVATLLSAIAQGLTAGIGYFFAGMDFLVLLVMLTTVFAMVPFIGPGVVWIPVCLYIGLYEERYLAASLLAAWGVLAVGTIDNIVKAVVLHGQSQLHPLLALLSVLGGVQALGPVGIVVGPMVVAMLQTLLSILQRELVRLEEQDVSVFRSLEPRARFKGRDATEGEMNGGEATASPAVRSETAKTVGGYVPPTRKVNRKNRRK